MAFRDESQRGAIEERAATLESDLAALVTQRAAQKALHAREDALRRELTRSRIALSQETRDPGSTSRRDPLRLLASVTVASPCDVSWDAMTGGDMKARFCMQCARHVHDLSAMTETEAEAFLQQSRGEAPCVRLYQRRDGTVMTQDCPVGVRRRRMRKFVAIAVAATATLGALPFAVMVTSLTETKPAKSTIMGQVAVLDPAQLPKDPVPSGLEPMQGSSLSIGSSSGVTASGTTSTEDRRVEGTLPVAADTLYK